MHGIASGDLPAWLGWLYAKENVDASGNMTCVTALTSDGNTLCNDSTGWAVAADGVVTNSLIAGLHGIMSLDKQTVVFTMSDGAGGYHIVVMTKM